MSADLEGENRPLHPNLARLDAAYDRIVERFALGQLDPPRANAEIAALVARDDEGTLWHKDPRTGGWLRRTRTGELVPDTPPTYGFATPTAYDLTPNPDGFRPDDHVVFSEVDESLMFAPSSLAGSTRLRTADDTSSRRPAPAVIVAATLAVVAVVALVVLAFSGGSAKDPAPAAPSTVPAQVSTAPAPAPQPGG